MKKPKSYVCIRSSLLLPELVPVSCQGDLFGIINAKRVLLLLRFLLRGILRLERQASATTTTRTTTRRERKSSFAIHSRLGPVSVKKVGTAVFILLLLRPPPTPLRSKSPARLTAAFGTFLKVL